MTTLEQQQHGLLVLLKNRASPAHESDRYLRQVAESKELELVREIAIWWRSLGIERNCPHTALLLKRLGRFEETVESFYCGQSASPYMEEMGMQFVHAMSLDSDPLVRVVAGFEFAVLRIALGDSNEYVIESDRDLGAVLTSLRSGDALPEPATIRRVTVSGLQSD